jgi:hypothetical protein
MFVRMLAGRIARACDSCQQEVASYQVNFGAGIIYLVCNQCLPQS